MRVSQNLANARGFTLIEIAVVLFILGLLIAGVLGPLEMQLEARDRRATIETMNEIVEALYGYAMTHGRFPCPDADGDGSPDMSTEPFDPADATSADCDGGANFNNGEGFLPWVALNVAVGDAWGNRFRYRVRWPHFTWPDADGICDGDDDDSATPGTQAPFEFDLCASGNIEVLTRGDNSATPDPPPEGKFETTIADSLPAVVISHGRNGYGAVSINGIARPLPAGGTDEAENTDGDATVYGRGYSAERSSCADNATEATSLCGFDDIVMWISPALLNNRMVTAGRLP